MFNKDQITALLAHIFAGSGIAVATTTHQAIFQILGGALFLLTMLVSHTANATDQKASTSQVKAKGPLLAMLALFAAISFTGCASETVKNPNGTTSTVTTLDTNAISQIDAIAATIIQEAPAAISDVQAISASVHGTNSASK